jgi:predicted transcriptional regulator
LANPDIIISMIDGNPYKTLTRHLTTNGLTPDEYRALWSEARLSHDRAVLLANAS